ncbi:ATP-binding protein [Spirulina sp. CS-785/01]|uniref:ATP-binding response regulator n=1 Tax=Spirulina sp. CS-785/01 TaxID=3021716 RepID=UPI0023300545|nr:ATP-binding protein [Spirulina sp. CS-785/01]MDB9312692.1 ATP-binding protein [Spirulina sp. CS-785/01]
MPHLRFALTPLLRSVPVCPETTDSLGVWKQFQASGEPLLVVVTPQNEPLGVLVREHYLSPDNFSPDNFSPDNFSPDNFSPDREGGELLADWQTLIQPLPLLSEMPDHEELQSVQRSNPVSRELPFFIVVNVQGKYRGLLDSWQLLQLQMQYPGLFPQTISETTETTLESLTQLLEQLPIPLMVQNNQGQVVQQNRTWQEQIGSESEGGEESLRELYEGNSAGMRPGYGGTPPTDPPSPAERLLSRWCNTQNPEVGEESNDTFLRSPASQSNAYEGSKTANLPKPQNKVWQFVKLPLQLTLSEPVAQKHGQFPLWLVLATDVTEQRQLCKELTAKNADLVQLNRLKDEFLSCISHELKTPLTAVLGLSSLLKDQKLGELNPRQSRYAQLIYQSGRQLMSVVNDILDLTRLETGQLQLTLEPVDLYKVCDRAYQQTLQQLTPDHKEEESNAENIAFELDIEPGLETIVADELRLRQMLIHLLENAIKFTPAGGQMGLKVSSWQGWIDFTVWDTGIGIPESSQHLIFQKFQQLESPLTRQFEGTGLGLVLTQRLARAHGGDISFISKVGKGSKFTLLLPPRPPSEGNQTLDPTSQSQPHQLALIVEAVPQYIERLTGQLQKMGYRVIIARSGTEALEKARQVQPRVIFLNPLLPLLSGWDVLTLLKSDPKTQDIPVVVTATRAEQQQATQNGADGFLSLPVKQSVLRQRLAQLRLKTHFSQKHLTILSLTPPTANHPEAISLSVDEFSMALSQQMSPLNYRILEADDLDQAELLSKVWKPNLLLLNGKNLQQPQDYLRSLLNSPSLTQLPLVTLDPPLTEAASQFPDLSVYPCLIPLDEPHLAILLQVMRVAAGITPQPNLLITGNSPVLPQETLMREVDFTQHPPTGENFIHALTQYLQTAGFQSLLSQSWPEIHSQIRNQSVDLLILNLEDEDSPPPWITGLQELVDIPSTPPILVLDHRKTPAQNTALNPLLAELATHQVICNGQEMTELLQHINRVVG